MCLALTYAKKNLVLCFIQPQKKKQKKKRAKATQKNDKKQQEQQLYQYLTITSQKMLNIFFIY